MGFENFELERFDTGDIQERTVKSAGNFIREVNSSVFFQEYNPEKIWEDINFKVAYSGKKNRKIYKDLHSEIQYL